MAWPSSDSPTTIDAHRIMAKTMINNAAMDKPWEHPAASASWGMVCAAEMQNRT